MCRQTRQFFCVMRGFQLREAERPSVVSEERAEQKQEAGIRKRER